MYSTDPASKIASLSPRYVRSCFLNSTGTGRYFKKDRRGVGVYVGMERDGICIGAGVGKLVDIWFVKEELGNTKTSP